MRSRMLSYGPYLPGHWRSDTQHGSRIVERGFRQAFFFLMATAQPSARLQLMVRRNQKFTLEVAAEQLVQVWNVLVSVPAEMEKTGGPDLEVGSSG